MMTDEPLFSPVELGRCPFVRLLADGNVDGARRLAAAPPDPAEPVVIDWLLAEARRHLAASLRAC
jgi:hypothetical protein